MIDTEEKTMSVKEFADSIGWSQSTVTRAIKEGRVKSANKAADGLKRIPSYRIPVSEVDRLRKEAQGAQGE